MRQSLIQIGPLAGQAIDQLDGALDQMGDREGGQSLLLLRTRQRFLWQTVLGMASQCRTWTQANQDPGATDGDTLEPDRVQRQFVQDWHAGVSR